MNNEQITATQNKQFLTYGQAVMLIDKRRRETYTVLQEGKVMNLNGNVIKHDEIVGLASGDRVNRRKVMHLKSLKQLYNSTSSTCIDMPPLSIPKILPRS